MVLLALTELVAEIAVWTLKKTVTYSWRGLWWGVNKARGVEPEKDVRITLQELQEKLDAQEKELTELKKIKDLL